ncbi:MAG: chorismate lyase [Gammaproteobacteria bacterium]|nr:chorismate lyase [Gammaproteobacteria bacterium]MDH5591823.1 chorismate lyase [Gammaproteobacteria bacterium]
MKHWTRWYQPQRRLMPPEMASWLTDTGSLTRRLKAHNKHGFSVQLLGNHWMKPLPDECLDLGTSMTQMAYQREVKLMDGDKANVYARTVVPLATFQVMKHRFEALGNKSLGELLFTDPSVKRGPIEIACLKPGQWLYEVAVLEEAVRPDELWGRRSHFYLSGKILLVNEIFLPTLDWSE